MTPHKPVFYLQSPHPNHWIILCLSCNLILLWTCWVSFLPLYFSKKFFQFDFGYAILCNLNYYFFLKKEKKKMQKQSSEEKIVSLWASQIKEVGGGILVDLLHRWFWMWRNQWKTLVSFVGCEVAIHWSWRAGIPIYKTIQKVNVIVFFSGNQSKQIKKNKRGTWEV